MAGLVSNVKRKNIESIAYLHEQDRQPLQKFIGQNPWPWQPMLGDLARQVGAALGEADGVLVFDPSGVLKQGKRSVGVARQWCGRAGKVDTARSVSTSATLPARSTPWSIPGCICPRNGPRTRSGVGGRSPKEVRFRTRHELALEMLREHGGVLPHQWLTGDDEMGRNSHFREELRTMNEQYLLAVPSNTLIRDLDAPRRPTAARGSRRRYPFNVRTIGSRRLSTGHASRSARARGGRWWSRLRKSGCRPSAVPAMVRRRRWWAFRERQGNKTIKHDYCLSNAPFDTPLQEFGACSAEHRIEECLRRAKGEAGLRSTRFARGTVGTIIRYSPCLPPGS